MCCADDEFPGIDFADKRRDRRAVCWLDLLAEQPTLLS
jgi:hypothetical protein